MADNAPETPEKPLSPFNRGDVVELNSGGPKMTVQSGGVKVVEAQWFDGSTLKKGIFLVETIKASGA